MNKFIFDVDGTLTPSRQIVDSDFEKFFLEFTKNNKVWLVTGSDYPKTKEQLGKEICDSVVTVYNCNGNDTWFKGKRVNSSDWVLSETAHTFLAQCLTESAFSLRTGQHFEHRKGMCNFSVIGRGANTEQRKMYVEFDKSINERNIISDAFNTMFPDLQATVGGETGIDISAKGRDKSQILSDFDAPYSEIHFFGDRVDPDGNDFPLAKVLKEHDGNVYHVKDWTDTYNLLIDLQSKGIAN